MITIHVYHDNVCFAVAYYVIFLSYDNPLTPEGIDDSVLNPMPTPTESIMAMFLMSVNTFTDYYTAFDKTSHTLVAKVCLPITVYCILCMHDVVIRISMILFRFTFAYYTLAQYYSNFRTHFYLESIILQRSFYLMRFVEFILKIINHIELVSYTQ